MNGQHKAFDKSTNTDHPLGRRVRDYSQFLGIKREDIDLVKQRFPIFKHEAIKLSKHFYKYFMRHEETRNALEGYEMRGQ
jgi:hypothetical protein